MCDSLRRGNFRSSWKAFLDKTSTAAYFFTIKALQRKKRKAQTTESYPHESLAGLFFSFFILPPTACLILIKPIRHSCLFVFHWIGWRYLIHSLTLRNKLRVFKSSCILTIQLKANISFFFLHKGEIIGISELKKEVHKFSICLSLKKKPLCKAHQPQRLWCWGASPDSEAD